jgi:hypothetical protein
MVVRFYGATLKQQPLATTLLLSISILDCRSARNSDWTTIAKRAKAKRFSAALIGPHRTVGWAVLHIVCRCCDKFQFGRLTTSSRTVLQRTPRLRSDAGRFRRPSFCPAEASQTNFGVSTTTPLLLPGS